MSDAPDCTHKSASLIVATATNDCWQCSHPGRVHGIILPKGFDYLNWDQDPPAWGKYSFESWVYYIEDPNPEFIALMASLAVNYKLSHTNTTDSDYWANVCEKCEAVQGDHFLYQSPGNAFSPTNVDDASKIMLTHHDVPFQAVAAQSYDVDLFSEFGHSNLIPGKSSNP